jgi:tetratricopeptide (TPR) repeat protein
MARVHDRAQPAPVMPDPYSRGFDREFRLANDNDNVIRINQRQPKGLPRKLAEFVPVAGITQPDVQPIAEAFIGGANRSIQLDRFPDHPVDPNAIAVVGTWVADGISQKGRLGYLPAKVAADLATLGPETPIAATVEVMYAPVIGGTLGIRLDIWGPRRKALRAPEQPQRTDIIVPADPVQRNVMGIELESQGLIENAIECYQRNVRDGFEGNGPYDRLAIIYRRRGDTEKELAVLRRAIEVFEQLQASPRSDVAPKLNAFRRRYEATLQESRPATSAPEPPAEHRPVRRRPRQTKPPVWTTHTKLESVATATTADLPPLPTLPPSLGRRSRGLLARLFGRADTTPRAEKRALDISTGTGGYDLAVVGESQYQMTLRRLAGNRRERREEVLLRAWLLPEPHNPYDRNAVAVVLDDGQCVGYLAREFAGEFQPALLELEAEGFACYCRAKLVGGYGDKRSLGVVLDVRDPRDGLRAPF